ncbi:hypothetical protein PYCC9005_000800 [Savitreella phatthalungensis]
MALTGVIAVAADKIHGHEVPADCVAAYKAAFEPEQIRTDKFVALAASVQSPADAKDRISKAAEALKAYQDVLKKVDANLADPIPEDDKTALKKAQAGTADVADALAQITTLDDAQVKKALADFTAARRAEMAATSDVVKKCPANVDLES